MLFYIKTGKAKDLESYFNNIKLWQELEVEFKSKKTSLK